MIAIYFCVAFAFLILVAVIARLKHMKRKADIRNEEPSYYGGYQEIKCCSSCDWHKRMMPSGDVGDARIRLINYSIDLEVSNLKICPWCGDKTAYCVGSYEIKTRFTYGLFTLSETSFSVGMRKREGSMDIIPRMPKPPESVYKKDHVVVKKTLNPPGPE